MFATFFWDDFGLRDLATFCFFPRRAIQGTSWILGDNHLESKFG